MLYILFIRTSEPSDKTASFYAFSVTGISNQNRNENTTVTYNYPVALTVPAGISLLYSVGNRDNISGYTDNTGRSSLRIIVKHHDGSSDTDIVNTGWIGHKSEPVRRNTIDTSSLSYLDQLYISYSHMDGNGPMFGSDVCSVTIIYPAWQPY